MKTKELKTLKDIKMSQTAYQEIRTEAVKHAKALKNEWNGEIRIHWIKHFFNLKETEIQNA